MSTVDLIVYDSTLADNITLENKLRTICDSFYRVDKNHILIKYGGSVKDLYENISPFLNGGRVLVVSIDDYYGYHDSELWDWLRMNK